MIVAESSRRIITGRKRIARSIILAASLLAGSSCFLTSSLALAPPIDRPQVAVKLRTGGTIRGVALDHTQYGLVLVRDKTPYAISWIEIESGSAVATRRQLMAWDRGGVRKLTADDHFELGLFALHHGRRDLASGEFRAATRLDRSYKDKVKAALVGADARGRTDRATGDTIGSTPAKGNDHNPNHDRASSTPPDSVVTTNEQVASDAAFFDVAPGPASEYRERVLQAYLTFGAKVRDVFGKSVVLIETEHFLIWTDWETRHHQWLANWCETMYTALSQRFGVGQAESVFLAKCPVFCWRGEKQFKRFAREFDGYPAVDSIGYTRSIERNGHVHVVLVRQGRSPADFDRFACTLVHEGTHAFVHRLFTSRLIPHWINEGLADLVAEQVLGDQCPNGENARLLARQFVRYDWPITYLLGSVGPIEVHEYPLAHSVVAFLERLGTDRFARFIRHLKAGQSAGAALAKEYDGLTLAALEDRWRAAVRNNDRTSFQANRETQVLPWATEDK